MTASATAKTVLIDAITVGERRRDDHGDINGLAESIKTYGLLHPPVVDDKLNLIAGERRLRACKLLGWGSIDVRLFRDLSAAEKDQIELEENRRRKDLTPYEAAKEMLTQATEKAFAVPNSVQQKSGSGGRNQKPDSVRNLAAAAGVTKAQVQRAQTQVETAESFPFMQAPGWKQYHVLQAAEQLEKIPEPERPKISKLLDQPGIPPQAAIPILSNLNQMPPAERAEVYALNESADSRDRDLAITKAAQMPPMPDPRLKLIGDATTALRKAISLFPDDEEVADFKTIIVSLKSLGETIRMKGKRDAEVAA